jgi:hypothetical protein
MKDFEEVRELQRTLKARSLRMATKADEAAQGPAYFQVTDANGNRLLFDRHWPLRVGTFSWAQSQPAAASVPHRMAAVCVD